MKRYMSLTKATNAGRPMSMYELQDFALRHDAKEEFDKFLLMTNHELDLFVFDFDVNSWKLEITEYNKLITLNNLAQGVLYLRNN